MLRIKNNILLALLVLLMILSPIVLFGVKSSDFGFIAASTILALPAAFLIASIKNKPVFITVLSLALLFSLAEMLIVKGYDNFVISGNILALFTTDLQESLDFAKNYLIMLVYFIPVVLVFWLAIKCHNRIEVSPKIQLLGVLASILLAIVCVSVKKDCFERDILQSRPYIERNILTRPPYNIFYQFRNVIKTEIARKYIKGSEGFKFSATREQTPENKEIYVLSIGESVAYDHVSLGGNYSRETTPRLEALDNVVSYSDYYSSACQTFYSIPQILTRATPDNYNLNFKEKSIISAFKEAGFKTFVIVGNNLLKEARYKYLRDGEDALVCVKKDIDVASVIDSLSSIYPKTFFVTQFLGCHTFYYNYEKEFDIYRPNVNSDPLVKSDSLFVNAYDNTVLYADYVNSEIIKAIDKPGASSTFTFISDHGEIVKTNGGGHGGEYKLSKSEYHVPLIVWYSETYGEIFPEKADNLKANKDKPVNCDNLFYSLCDMSGIQLAPQYSNAEYSIFSASLAEHERKVVLPDGLNTLNCE